MAAINAGLGIIGSGVALGAAGTFAKGMGLFVHVCFC